MKLEDLHPVPPPASYARFSAHKCNLCSSTDLSKKIQLCLCSGCRLVYYCGVAHQKMDYPVHKKLCIPIRSIYKKHRIHHMLDLHGPIENRCQLHKTILSFKVLIMMMRQEPLDYFEEDILTFPKYCEVCFKHSSKYLFDCDKCGEVSYCSEDHRNQNLEKHKKICAALKIYYNFRDNVTVLPLEIKGNKMMVDITTDLPRMMEAILKSDNLVREPKTSEEYCTFAAIATFSYASTVLYAIRTLLNMYEEFVTVIFVGVHQEAIYFDESRCEFLITQMPQVRNLNLVFIGPELTASEEDCIVFKEGLVVKREFHAHTIQHFILNNKRAFTFRPKLIVCFNCGFGEHFGSPNDTWGAGIKAMLSYSRVPILFTSYTTKEANTDADVIKKCAADSGKSIKIFSSPNGLSNPFKDFRPLRNSELNDEEDLIYYRNGYLQIAIRDT